MHPTAKFALQKRILAAFVQADAFQLHLSQCLGSGDLKDRSAALAKDVGKENRATVLKECEIQSIFGTEENKGNFWVCFITCRAYLRNSLLVHYMGPGGQGKRQCAMLVKYFHIQ